MSEVRQFVGSDKITFPIYDVTHHRVGEDIDFGLLDVVRTAPALLTSAERLMLFTLVYSIRPKRYLEIGVLHGGASIIVARAMDAVGYEGKMVLVDIDPQIDSTRWEQMKHRAILIQGGSPEILTEAREAAGGPFDFVFIDAGHSTHAVMRDANGVFPYLEDGAYLLFHDSCRPAVREAIDVFVRTHMSSIVDFGLITREFGILDETRKVDPDQLSNGFRVLQLRRRHGRMRPVNAVRGLQELWYRRLRSVAKRVLRPTASA